MEVRIELEEWRGSSSAKLSRTAVLTADSSSIALTRYGSRWSEVRRKVLEAFVPEGYPGSVTPDYLPFQVWDSLQGLSTYVRSMLSTQALLSAIGVGEKSATVIGATFQWFLRDFTGMLGGILFTFYQGSNLDSNAKMWRLVADFMNDLGMLMDLVSPLFPSALIAIVCFGSLSRSFTGVASGATRAALTQHFSLENNAADISAKEGSQETLATMMGMAFGMLLAHVTRGHPLAVWISFLLLTLFHMYANYKAVRCLSLKTLNNERSSLLLQCFMETGQVLSPQQVSSMEHVFPAWFWSWSSSHAATLYRHITLGVKVSSLKHSDVMELAGSASLHYKKVNYLLLQRDGHIQVIIDKQSTPQDILQSFIHALVILKLLDKAKAVHIESRQWMDDNYTVFLAKLRSAGWSTERLLSHSIVWRAHWTEEIAPSLVRLAGVAAPSSLNSGELLACQTLVAGEVEDRVMDSFFQSTTLVASSSYPNSIAWSEENLVAIASGHIITILSPASIVSPRGLITLPPNKPFPIGAVKKEDLNAACLMPNLLSRENRPCSRSISWSPLGLAANSGCLLAVCTTEGRVKIYQAPFCELSSEWVEVADVSDMLLYYLDSIKFGELMVPEQANSGHVIEWQESSISKVPKGIKRSHDASESTQTLLQSRKCNLLSQVTAKQYSSRRALLSSTIVAWSPVLHSSANYHFSNSFCGSCSILATGGKSGNISFWRICEPPCYTIEHGRLSADPVLIGLLQAHNSWITAISWAISPSSSLEPQLILSTGSYDGSVKLWTADISALIESAEPNKACFSLLKEVASASSIPISTISLVVPTQSSDMVILAAGKGSGSIEVYICHISNNEFQSIGIYDGHDQVVTGLVWSFNGSCLYSCSQDNSVRCWALHQNSLLEVFFPSAPCKSSTKYLQVSDPCFGIALSPGGLMIALVHSFDANLLNPMYQARTQKAAAEFFWIGGQSLMAPSEKHPDHNPETISGSSENDLMCWESNILWSLECFENVDKPLSLWDVIAALVHFRKTTPVFLENLLIKWISKWFGLESVDSIEKILLHALSMLSNLSSRKLHLLNIICRRLMLIKVKASVPNGIQDKSNGLDDDEKILWENLLIKVEGELRQRLVAFSFRAVLSHAPCSSSVAADVTNWLPNGIVQMEQWLTINSDFVHPRLKLLGTKIREIKNSDCIKEESCSFCLASVPFQSPDTATCAGNKLNKNHQLSRCAVSMQLCSITVPMWFCICCKRWAARLIPKSFFTMSEASLDEPLHNESPTVQGTLKPLCPFCGVLTQRLLPDFLLSASPV